MIRTFFAGLGVLFATLLVFSASFVGNLALELTRRGPDYERLAVDITRDLARSWAIEDIAPRYADAIAHTPGGLHAPPSFAALKPLGPLLYADDLTHSTRWSRQSLRELRSPAAAAEMLAGLLSKTVHVTFVAKFAQGVARVSVELRSEGGAMKLWHLQIESRDRLPEAPPPAPRAISHA
jgi:hypothetical protein